MSHTKEPWVATPEENGCEWGIDAGRWGVAVCADAPGDGTAEANARRIVACVNACAGTDNKWLESMAKAGGFKAMDHYIAAYNQAAAIIYEKQRDELLAALEKQVADVKHCQQVMLNEVGIGFLDVVTLANSESAIASAKGGAA